MQPQLKLSWIAWQLVAIFQLLQTLYTRVSLEKGKALQKGKALEKGTKKMATEDVPDWGDEVAPEVKKEPAAAEAKKSPSPLARHIEETVRSGRGGSGHRHGSSKEAAKKKATRMAEVEEEDGWEKGWDHGWGYQYGSSWSHDKNSGWSWEEWDDQSWGGQWEDDQWSSYDKKTWDDDDWTEAKPVAPPKKGGQLRQQCPDTDNHVLRLAAMGQSRYKRLQKRLEEQRLKKEQDERMEVLESQVSQLNECNMQWMHYYQQQQNQQWQAAAAWQWEAHAQQAYAAQAAGHMEGLRLFFSMHGLFSFLFWHHVMQNLYHICAATCSLVCFVLLAGQGDGRTRKHEETSHATSSTDTAARGLFVCGDCCFCL